MALRLGICEKQKTRAGFNRRMRKTARPVVGTYYYPQVSHWFAIDQPSVRSVNRFHPRHRASVPGGPSQFLAKYPPNLAINITASAIVGASVGAAVARDDLIVSTVHSTFERNGEQGSDGLVRAINVIMNNLQATMLMSMR